MSDELRVEEWPTGWAVIDRGVDPHEVNNWGLLAAGFPNEAEARAWLENYRLEEQCIDWEMHVQSEQHDPMPF